MFSCVGIVDIDDVTNDIDDIDDDIDDYFGDNDESLFAPQWEGNMKEDNVNDKEKSKEQEKKHNNKDKEKEKYNEMSNDNDNANDVQKEAADKKSGILSDDDDEDEDDNDDDNGESDNEQKEDLMEEEALSWTKDQVGIWISNVLHSKCDREDILDTIGKFRIHKIDGETLLDLTKEDMKGMGIHIYQVLIKLQAAIRDLRVVVLL